MSEGEHVSRKRDALTDLAVCERATRGPWIVGHWKELKEIHAVVALRDPIPERPNDLGVAATLDPSQEVADNDAQFIALSREALPYWISRAVELEKALGGAKDALANGIPLLHNHTSIDDPIANKAIKVMSNALCRVEEVLSK